MPCVVVFEVMGFGLDRGGYVQGPLSPSGRTFREAAGEVDGGAGEGARAEARLRLSGRGARNLRVESGKMRLV